MQLTLKANPHKLKQIRYITSQKESQTTPTKIKKQKNNQYNNCCIIEGKERVKDLVVQTSNALQSRLKELQTTFTKTKKRNSSQCNNCCIVEKKEQIKDLVVYTSNSLQSCFPTYNSKYDSKVFVEDYGCQSLHIVFGMTHACFAVATLNPIGLIPIITNAVAIKCIKLDRDLINSVERPQLATDLISYLNAINREGYLSIHRLFIRRDCIENEIRNHKKVNTQTLSSLDLKNALNNYNVKLIELEKSEDIINSEILEPILPILNKYENVDIEKCLTYTDTLKRTAAFKRRLLVGGSLAIYLSTLGIVVDGTDNVLIAFIATLSMLDLIGTPLIMDNDLSDKMNIISNCLKIYKNHLATIQNNAFVKTLENKKNIE